MIAEQEMRPAFLGVLEHRHRIEIGDCFAVALCRSRHQPQLFDVTERQRRDGEQILTSTNARPKEAQRLRVSSLELNTDFLLDQLRVRSNDASGLE